MADERTLRLAHHAVTPEILAKYEQFVAQELEGKSAADALRNTGLTADQVARTASAVNAFCRPRVLKERLKTVSAKTPEKQMGVLEALKKPIDDTDFVALYGAQTHQVLLSREEGLIELRLRTAADAG